MKTVRRALCAGALVFMAGLSCNDASGPVAGSLKISLTTPNSGADGAIVVFVTAPVAPVSAAAPAGLRVFYDSLGMTAKFAVTGTLSAGTILTIGVDDVGRVAEYTATVQQVADASYQLRPSLAGYALAVTK